MKERSALIVKVESKPEQILLEIRSRHFGGGVWKLEPQEALNLAESLIAAYTKAYVNN